MIFIAVCKLCIEAVINSGIRNCPFPTCTQDLGANPIKNIM